MTKEELYAFKNMEILEKAKKQEQKLYVRVPKGNLVYRYNPVTGDITKDPSFKIGDKKFKVVDRLNYLYIHAKDDKNAERRFREIVIKLNAKLHATRTPDAATDTPVDLGAEG